MLNNKYSVYSDLFDIKTKRKSEKDKNSFLYELALERGKNRGWYPKDWTLNEYINYLFYRDLRSI